MNELDRLKNYTEKYLIGDCNPEDEERYPYQRKSLKENIWVAACYAYGILDPVETRRVYQFVKELKFDKQMNIITEMKYKPTGVLDVGTGRGELLAAFIYKGTPCIGIDPSEGSMKVVPKTLKNWCNISSGGNYFRNLGFYDGLVKLWEGETEFDTIILSESIEHIPADEFSKCLSLLEQHFKGRLIINNWLTHHPIQVDNTHWDHITRIDDDYYDWISHKASKTLLRYKSHLVVEF